MALGILTLLLAGMSAVSAAGLLIMYLAKKEKIRRILFVGMSVWGMLIASFGALSQPSNRVGQQLLFAGFGLLAAAGLIVGVRMKRGGGRGAACALVTLSVLGSMLKLWF